MKSPSANLNQFNLNIPFLAILFYESNISSFFMYYTVVLESFFIGKIGFEINLSSNDYYTGNKILILMQNIEL